MINATGTVDPEELFPGVVSELVFTLPLPAGFTISASSEWMVTLPPGFTLPASSTGDSVSFFGLSPYQSTAINNPPQTMGPITEPIDSFPAGTLWVWIELNNQQPYGNITLNFILMNVVNPTTTGLTGNFLVRIGGTGSTNCQFTVPGFTIAEGD
jgi:hypothetical protein